LIPLAARASVGDDDEITNALDSMVDGLGLSNQVNRAIEAMHQNQEAAEQQARFIHVDEDGHAIMMACLRFWSFQQRRKLQQKVAVCGRRKT
jgi:hypothetical protein